MQLTRFNLNQLYTLITRLKDKQFNISTQYKFLVLSKEIDKEKLLYDEQLSSLIDTFGEKDEKGNFIQSEDGGIKLKAEKKEECKIKYQELNSLLITLPDLYFSLDELTPLGLTLGELEVLEPFIKN